MTEAEIKNRIRLAVGKLPSVKLFNSPTGDGWAGKTLRITEGQILIGPYRRVQFGLCPGSCDLIGWRAVTITPEMVGQQVAQFVGVEVKSATGKLRPDQENFIRVLRESGGCAGVARSVEEAITLLEEKT